MSMIGKTILHYKILARLGEGGMGVVYKARDTKLDRDVAIKFLPRHVVANAEERERFKIEAKAAAALNHPNIATIYAIEGADDEMFIVMEFINGKELRQIVGAAGRPPLPIDQIINLAAQIVDGLKAAHAKGVTHRDIKSSNIMVIPNESGARVKIMDFGLAKIGGGVHLTKSGTTVGTAAYMSPEQARGEPVDHRTDIWAFGVVLYEMLTGRLPFRGEYEAAMMYSVLNENPQPPRELRPGLPMEMEQIILRALEKNREQRFQSAAEILPALKKLSGESAIAVTKSGDFKILLAFLKRPRFAIPAVLLVVLLATAVFVPYQRLIKLRQAETLLPQIEKLAQDGKYIESYDLAIQVEGQLDNDSTLARLLPEIADHFTVITQPEGARAYLKRFTPTEPSSPREDIGATPIRNLRVARNDYKLTLEKDGFIRFECIVSSKLGRLEAQSSEIKIEVKLAAAASAGENQVFVPGGKYRLVSWAAPTKTEVRLDDFFIDKYEVTNAQYRAFIAAGKSLPTIFQWEKAARDGRFSHALGMVMPWGMLIPGETNTPRANFEGQSAAAVDSFEFGLSPYGCFNMAGNVKEWCRNEITGGYTATGGSWEDPIYLFADYGAFSGFYSSGALGFRCVRNLAGAASAQGAMKIDLAERTPVFNPVPEAAFRNFLRFYQYDKKPLQAKVVETAETADWTREKVLFNGVDAERMIAYLFLPRRASMPYQCLNFIPHSGVLLGGVHTAEAAEYIFAPHLKSGRAVLAVVPKGAKEREWPLGYVRPEIGTVKYRELVRRYVTEFSLGLDYLETRDDIDMSKIAYVGVSWGAQGPGLICPVVDKRYRSVIWIGSAVDQEDMEKLPEANPINFAPYLKPPKLLLQGKYDENAPMEIYARPLYELLREPKKLVLVEGGHFPPLEARVSVINKFLDETLGAVKFE
jgi:tRNA A-37 threonylcarbamoyl transferase component Bud32